MRQQDWLVTETGECLGYNSPKLIDLLRENEQYRLYRFLTEVEDWLNQSLEENLGEVACLTGLRRLVRKWLLKCDWLHRQVPEPATEQGGVGITILYDEPGFLLTLQLEKMLPGTATPIHNHGTWGVVAMVEGSLKNSFWQLSPQSLVSNRVQLVAEQIFYKDDILSLTTDAIHQVAVVGDEPVVTLNFYGETLFSRRSQFEPVSL